MQIIFTSSDGKEITVSDPRRPAAKASVPQVRRPTGWNLTSWKFLTMKV